VWDTPKPQKKKKKIATNYIQTKQRELTHVMKKVQPNRVR